MSLIAFAVLCVLVPSGSVVYLTFQAGIAQLRTLQLERAHASAQEVDAYLQDLLRKLGYLGRVRGLTEVPPENLQGLLQGLIRHNSAFEAVALTDGVATVASATAPGSRIRMEEVARAAPLRRVLTAGEEWVGEVEIDPDLGLPLLTVAVPVRDSADRVQGALVARLNLEYLWSILERVQVGRTGYAYLVDGRSFLVAEQGTGPRDVLEDLSGRRFLRELLLQPARELPPYQGLREREVLGAAARVPSVEWNVVVELPTAEAYAPTRRLAALLLGGAVLAGILAALVSLVFARRVLRPLASLTEAASRIRTGHLEVRVEVRRRDELGVLAAAFNEMAGRLQALVKDLERRLEELRQAGEERARLLVTERAARAEAEEGRNRASFLARGSALLTESLDFEAAIRGVAHLMVPWLADWCVIDLLEKDGRTRRLAGAHADPEKEPLLEELAARLPADRESPQPAGVVLRSGTPLLLTEFTPVRWAHAVGPEAAELVARLGAGSAIAVPLLARGRTLGAITLVASAPGRYRPTDLTLAQDVARRIALAVDNMQLLRQAQEALQAQDRFLSNAAHELRTPLTPLLAQLQSLHRAAADRELPTMPLERVAARLKMGLRQGQRLSRLVDGLLDVSQITAGHLRIQREELDLAALVREVAGRYAAELANAGCELSVHAATAVVGRWDRLRLEQVAASLLGNAIKYGAGKPIEVLVEATPSIARLVVRDHGIGVSAADQPRIFARFERAVSERYYGGLGLGLYIAREIIEAHGGTIRVESAPGEGSTFTLELPLGPGGAPAERPVGGEGGLPGGASVASLARGGA